MIRITDRKLILITEKQSTKKFSQFRNITRHIKQKLGCKPYMGTEGRKGSATYEHFGQISSGFVTSGSSGEVTRTSFRRCQNLIKFGQFRQSVMEKKNHYDIFHFLGFLIQMH